MLWMPPATAAVPIAGHLPSQSTAPETACRPPLAASCSVAQRTASSRKRLCDLLGVILMPASSIAFLYSGIRVLSAYASSAAGSWDAISVEDLRFAFFSLMLASMLSTETPAGSPVGICTSNDPYPGVFAVAARLTLMPLVGRPVGISG